MLSAQEKSQLKAIVSSPHWGTFERIAQMMDEEIRNDYGARANQWETIRTTLLNDGKRTGIGEFLQRIINEAQ